MSPSLPKKNLLSLLSIPITLNPFFEKKRDDYEQTKPQDPVIKANLIKRNS